ncbi:hypothetical protein [Streptomyces canus]|uniref:hypothetical protein n=1 Tax=Streptomyces canus TaxID=58343 RepID=UPI0027D8C253|nr:hypothetical protein [Streptomyces canus]
MGAQGRPEPARHRRSRRINRDPDAWYGGQPHHCADEVFSDYRAARRDPKVVHAMCEDYRAGLTIDRRDDEADKAAGRKLGCPVLVAWGRHDDLPDLYGRSLDRAGCGGGHAESPSEVLQLRVATGRR